MKKQSSLMGSVPSPAIRGAKPLFTKLLLSVACLAVVVVTGLTTQQLIAVPYFVLPVFLPLYDVNKFWVH